MPPIVLATCGENVKIWGDPNYELSHHIGNTHSSNVSSICWSPDGNWLASTSSSSNKLQINYVKGRSSMPLELTPEVPQTFVRYGNTSSRHILTCSWNSPTVSLWDVKTHKVIKNFQTSLNTGVLCAAHGHGDTHIACGGRNGAVVLLNVVNSITLQPMIAPKVQGITGLEYSYLHRDLLGTVSEDGACNLWNCNYRKLVKTFPSAHSAPASGIAFSPINEMLLITIGLDKRMIFYDSQSKKTLMTRILEEPLTSLDFTPDGTCVAVGTTRGFVFVYDLRSSSSPLLSIKAHSTSVQSLCYKRTFPSKGSLKGGFSKESVILSHPGLSKTNVILSPVLDNSTEKMTKQVSPCTQHIQDVSIMDVLSPVQSNELGNNELASPIFNKATTRPPLENVNVHFYPLAPAKLQKQNESPSKISLLMPNDVQDYTMKDDEPETTSPPLETPDHHVSLVETPSSGSITCSNLEITAKVLSQDDSQNNIASKSDSIGVMEKSSADYQTLLHRLEDMHFEIHTDISTRHAEMLKEIFFLQLAIEAVAKKCEVVDELLSENHRLRQENEILKKNF